VRDLPESVTRALAHHERTGAIQTFSPPIPGEGNKWRISLWGQSQTLSCSARELTALVYGLAAGEQRERYRIGQLSHQDQSPIR
jgi:hypothetical protein